MATRSDLPWKASRAPSKPQATALSVKSMKMSSIFDIGGRDSSMPPLCSVCLGMFAPEAPPAVRLCSTAAMPRWPPSEPKGLGIGTPLGKARTPWPETLRLLAPPPGVASAGRFAVDVASSSRLFVDVSPDEGDPEGTSPRFFKDVDSSVVLGDAIAPEGEGKRGGFEADAKSAVGEKGLCCCSVRSAKRKKRRRGVFVCDSRAGR